MMCGPFDPNANAFFVALITALETGMPYRTAWIFAGLDKDKMQ